MLNKLKPKSEFSRNVLTLMTGTTIAQAIPIAISPILTRIYTPEDFGMFALYMSIASILSVVATGRYELAIMLPKKDEDAVNIVALSIIISFFVSFISLAIVFVFNAQITQLLGNPEISSWLYFIPVTVLLTGVYQSFNYWSNRQKQYKRLATSRVIQSGTVSSTNLAMGFNGFGASGLILGGVLGQGVATTVLGRLIFKEDRYIFENIKIVKIFALAKRYIKFPKITLPHSVFNTISTQLPIFIITYYFSSRETGFFSFANKIVMLPIGLISNAYYQVFFESFSKEKNKETFFKQKFKQINILFLPLFILLWFIFPDLFAFVFGKEWETAGSYTQVLLPLFYLKFISNLFTTTTYLYYEKQFENFILEILIAVMILSSLLTGAYFKDILLGLILMSITNGMVIFYKIYRSFIFISENRSFNC